MSVAGADARAPSWMQQLRSNVACAVATLLRVARGPALPPVWPWLVGGGLAIAAAVVLLMAFVDAPVMALAKLSPAWVFAVVGPITDLGLSGWFLVPLALVLAVFGGVASAALPRLTRLVLAVVAVRCGFLFMAIAAPGLLAAIVKRVIGRARPYVESAGSPYLYSPMAWRSDYASLPSGHATTAFAALVAFGALWPRLRPLMWVYALAIGISRVVMVAHHPSDVVAGAAFGAAGAWLVRDWFAARRLGFSVVPDGGVRALPGPSFTRIKRVAARLLAP